MTVTNILEFKYSEKYCPHGTYTMVRGHYFLECTKCKQKIEPMYVLEEMAKKESRFFDRLRELERLQKELEGKMHCKCQYCGHMTRIYR